jgi:PTS system nitrogen regulatory IIA component
MHIQQLISLQRVATAVAVSSKKALLETLSAMLASGAPEMSEQAVLSSLMDREQLGSTGIGEGVALPHGRVKGLSQAVGAFVTLEQEMDYEALDRKPVRMAFALLVPEAANNEHLKVLRELATIFSNRNTREHLLKAHTAEELLRGLNESSPRA